MLSKKEVVHNGSITIEFKIQEQKQREQIKQNEIAATGLSKVSSLKFSQCSRRGYH